MKKSTLLEHLNIYLDMAIEAHDIIHTETGTVVSGVRLDKETKGEITVTTLQITNEEGVQKMGRPQGHYVTIESQAIVDNDYTVQKEITLIIARQLETLFQLQADSSFLIVGLGNRQATPDALGPKVIEQVLVTRHLFDYVPEDLDGHLRNVSAIAPGVLGLTGIETAEVLRGLVEHIKPDYLIAIDALASASLDRIGKAIQITDTGINPGAGIGNHRKALNKATLGCPVIAIGIPTVVNAAVIAHETLEELLKQMQTQPAFGPFHDEDQEMILDVLERTLSPFRENLMVTPKEIDHLIDKASHIIAGGLNICLHPGVTANNFETYQM